tara:strand:+ start:556 stop:1479 length:924 start_codon:yes stop_codon:yes gene_type:complete
MTKAGFQRMKEDSRSGETLGQLLEHQDLSGYSIQKQGRIIRNRVIDALRVTGEAEHIGLADRIENCGRGRLCGSAYCSDCRKRAVTGLSDRISRHIESRYGSSKKKIREQLRYVTVLCELVDLDYGSVKTARKRAQKDLDALVRRFKGTWIQGTYELELMDMGLLDKSDAGVAQNKRAAKQRTLAALKGVDVKDSGSLGQQVIVHFHALVDLNGVDGDQFKEWVRRRWNADGRQTRIQLTDSSQSWREMVSKIASYGFKNRVQYNLTFETNDYLKGKWFKNEDLAELVMIYDGLRNKRNNGLLIGRG